MKLGVLFSGGKDSTLATYLTKEKGHEIACLITIFSKNKESYMFHIPSISKTKHQAEAMDIPLMVHETEGEKEEELTDLEEAIKEAREKFNIQGIVTGAVASVYQASRIQKICDELDLECINPLWEKPQVEVLNELIKNNFEVIVIGISAYPLEKEWIGRKIDENFVKEIKELNDKYKINPAGEGGEFESFVLNCPLFKKGLEVKSYEDFPEGKNSWRREIEVE